MTAIIYANTRTREVKLADPSRLTADIEWHWNRRGLVRIGTVTFDGIEVPKPRFETDVDDEMVDAVAKAAFDIYERGVTKVGQELHRLRYAN